MVVVSELNIDKNLFNTAPPNPLTIPKTNKTRKNTAQPISVFLFFRASVFFNTKIKNKEIQRTDKNANQAPREKLSKRANTPNKKLAERKILTRYDAVFNLCK